MPENDLKTQTIHKYTSAFKYITGKTYHLPQTVFVQIQKIPTNERVHANYSPADPPEK